MSGDKNASRDKKSEARERVGKGSSRELRRNGLIPAVIYGDKQAPISIALSTNEVTKRIHAGGFMTTVATIDVDGKKIKVLPKDYQLDPVRDFTMHVDFLRVSGNSLINVEIPVHFENEEKSDIKIGGVLNIVRHTVEMQVVANDIPEFITVDLEGFKIGDSIRIAHVKLPKGAKPTIPDRDFTIATIVAPAAGADSLEKMWAAYSSLVCASSSWAVDGQHRLSRVKGLPHRELKALELGERHRIVKDTYGQQLHPDMTFKTYWVDPANAASFATIKILDPACGSGHFLVYGTVGAGKTHVLNAFADLGIRFGHRVRMLSAQYLFWRFSTGRLSEDLHDKVGLDLLVIDDAQFFSGLKLTSDFKHLFSRLVDSATWILMAADRSPWNLDGIDPMIHSLLIRAVSVELKRPTEAIGRLRDISYSPAQRLVNDIDDGDPQEYVELAKIIACQAEGAWTIFNDRFRSPFDTSNMPSWRVYSPLYDLLIEVADNFDLKLSELWLAAPESDEEQAKHVAVFLLEEVGRLSSEELEAVFGVTVSDTLEARRRVEASIVMKDRVSTINSSFVKRLEELNHVQTSNWSGIGQSSLNLRFSGRKYR